MIGFGTSQKYFVYRHATDMRKGVWSLGGMVRNEMDGDPMDGAVYIFFSKSYQTVKLLTWDKDGFVVYMKRLEKGRFEAIGKLSEGQKQEISYQFLVMLLSGISLIGMKQRPRYKMA